MLFRKTKDKKQAIAKPQSRGLAVLSVITQDTNILGTLISGGSIDFDGTIDGNIRCHTLTVRKNGKINGDVNAETLNVYGKINGIVHAKHVHLYTACHVEGVIMHEVLIIEDGAFMDGKCKRTDKPNTDNDEIIEPVTDIQIANNIRLIS
ncbi:MAG: polymer-forming cytoskeletal protein [Rickettsiales bacterium]|jgi:cytoskeletal protein CcmA (bactofilin family)